MDPMIAATCRVPAEYQGVELDRLQHRDDIEAYCFKASIGEHDGHGLWLCGPVGTGKSMALAYIAARTHELATANPVTRVSTVRGARVEWTEARDFSAIYAPCWQIVTALRERGRGQDRDAVYLNSLRTCDLLCLDEVGASYEAPWMASWFAETTEARYSEQRPTCLATNLTPAQFTREPDWERMADRLKKRSWVLGFVGESQRKPPDLRDLREAYAIMELAAPAGG